MSAPQRQANIGTRNQAHRDLVESINRILDQVERPGTLSIAMRSARDWDSVSAEEQALANILYLKHLNHYWVILEAW